MIEKDGAEFCLQEAVIKKYVTIEMEHEYAREGRGMTKSHAVRAAGVALVLASSQLFAAGEPKIPSKPGISNIGFMENPPEELKQQFPMCDAFLKIAWIDTQKRIGYSRYDIYKNGRKIKTNALALVQLDEYKPRFDYDLGEKEREGRLQEVYSIIKRGEVTFDTGQCSCTLGITFEKGNQRWEEDFSFLEPAFFTLADNRKNVCIPYPDNQRMWIAELKTVKNVSSSEELASELEMLKTWVPQFLDTGIDNLKEIPIGRKIYFINGATISYPVGDKYFEMQPLWGPSGEDDTWGKWQVPPSGNVCSIKAYDGKLYWTTDGVHLFVNNHCNLSDLIGGGG